MRLFVDNTDTCAVVQHLAAHLVEVVAMFLGGLGHAMAHRAPVERDTAAHAQVDVLAGRFLLQTWRPFLRVHRDYQLATVHVVVVVCGYYFT